MSDLTKLSGEIRTHIANNPQDANVLLLAVTRGTDDALGRAQEHASNCQHAVAAMAMLCGKERVREADKALLFSMLAKSLPGLDDTKATKDFLAKIGGDNAE